MYAGLDDDQNYEVQGEEDLINKRGKTTFHAKRNNHNYRFKPSTNDFMQ